LLSKVHPCVDKAF
jgi:hypothetical protein